MTKVDLKKTKVQLIEDLETLRHRLKEVEGISPSDAQRIERKHTIGGLGMKNTRSVIPKRAGRRCGKNLCLGGFTITIILAFSLGSPRQAIALEPPSGTVILEVSGSIQQTNAGGVASFDRKMLEQFEWLTIITETPWTDGDTRFEGPLLRKVLEKLGAKGKSIVAQALNDYQVIIPMDDFWKYDVILAIKMNGEFLTPRTKGYIWIIYPWNEHKHLRTEVYHSRSIWQLKRLVVK